MYSIDDIADLVGKSKQSLYKLIKNNKELSPIVTQNKQTVGKLVMFDQPVVDWFIDYYKPNLEKESIEKSSLEDVIINDLRDRVAYLEQQIKEKDDQIKKANEISSQALLELNLERTEKMKLLEAPKRGFFARLFERKGSTEDRDS